MRMDVSWLEIDWLNILTWQKMPAPQTGQNMQISPLEEKLIRYIDKALKAQFEIRMPSLSLYIKRNSVSELDVTI